MYKIVVGDCKKKTSNKLYSLRFYLIGIGMSAAQKYPGKLVSY